MKKLSKVQVDRRDALVEALTAARAKVEEAIAEYNRLLEAGARPFADEILGEMESFFDEQSDGWQESDAGQAYEGWMSERHGEPGMAISGLRSGTSVLASIPVAELAQRRARSCLWADQKRHSAKSLCARCESGRRIGAAEEGYRR
jgi:hypothetical protein